MSTLQPESTTAGTQLQGGVLSEKEHPIRQQQQLGTAQTEFGRQGQGQQQLHQEFIKERPIRQQYEGQREFGTGMGMERGEKMDSSLGMQRERGRGEIQQQQHLGHMISTQMSRAILNQSSAEMLSSHQMLACALWCEDKQLRGFCRLFLEEAMDECCQYLSLQCYLIKRRAAPFVEEIPAPRNDFRNILELVEFVYNKEVHFTQRINSLLLHAMDNQDVQTVVKLRAFVQHQIESCDKWFTILEKTQEFIKTPGLIYELDREFLFGKETKLGRELHDEYKSGRYVPIARASKGELPVDLEEKIREKLAHAAVTPLIHSF